MIAKVPKTMQEVSHIGTVVDLYQAAVKVAKDLSSFEKCGDDADARVATLTTSEPTWSALSVAMDAWTQCSKTGEKVFEAESSVADEWNTAKERCENLISRAGSASSEFVAAASALRLKDIDGKMEELKQVSGGMLGGGSWKVELDGSCDLPAAIATAATTLFKQRGLKAKMESAIATLRSAIDPKTSSDFGSMPFVLPPGVKADIDKEIALAHATLAEAAFLQLLRGGSGKLSAAATARLQSEVDFLTSEKVDVRVLLPAIWAEVQTRLGG